MDCGKERCFCGCAERGSMAVHDVLDLIAAMWLWRLSYLQSTANSQHRGVSGAGRLPLLTLLPSARGNTRWVPLSSPSRLPASRPPLLPSCQRVGWQCVCVDLVLRNDISSGAGSTVTQHQGASIKPSTVKRQAIDTTMRIQAWLCLTGRHAA